MIAAPTANPITSALDSHAPDLGHARELYANLSNFQPSLPADVRVRYDLLIQ
jgi:hypothetical protein